MSHQWSYVVFVGESDAFVAGVTGTYTNVTTVQGDGVITTEASRRSVSSGRCVPYTLRLVSMAALAGR